MPWDTFVWRIAEEDLRYTCYVIKMRQMLSEDATIKRNRSRMLKKYLAASYYFEMKISSLWFIETIVGSLNIPSNVHVVSGDVTPHFFEKGEIKEKRLVLVIFLDRSQAIVGKCSLKKAVNISERLCTYLLESLGWSPSIYFFKSKFGPQII